jgi:hypothetical protein
MVSSFGCLDPAAALTYPAQLAPTRRAQVAHDPRDTAISVDSMIVAGNTKITDLLCVTPPPFPHGAHSMTLLVELPLSSRQTHSSVENKVSFTNVVYGGATWRPDSGDLPRIRDVD